MKDVEVEEDENSRMSPRLRSLIGILLMIVASMSYSISTCLLKIIMSQSSVGSFEITSLQSLWVCILCYTYSKAFAKESDLFHLSKEERVPMFWRAIFGYIGLIGLYLSVAFTTLTKATVIFWTMPIFTALYARCFLQETLSVYDWFACFIAFFGMFLM